MTGTELPLRCQLGDCGNRAALTVTVELPVEWSDARTYNVVTLQVAVCGDCAGAVQARGQELLKARASFARRLETTAHYAELMRAHLALIEAVGAPYEPVQGTPSPPGSPSSTSPAPSPPGACSPSSSGRRSKA